MPDDTHIDLRQRVSALEQMFVAPAAERDEGLQQESTTRFTHPPPRRGGPMRTNAGFSEPAVRADAAALVGRPP